MLKRIRKSMEEKDQGFTLIELLVVMIIIGILAAIAVPVFLNQRKKARDTATKSDVSNAGREIATYYVDGVNQLSGALSGTTLTVTDTTTSTVVATVKLSPGTDVVATNPITYLATTATNCSAANVNTAGWYIGLKNVNGSQGTFYYAANGGLLTAVPTACAA